MVKKIAVILMLMTLVVAFGAQAQDAPLTVGLLLPTTGNDYVSALISGAEAAAEELSLELVIASADLEVETELEQFNELAERGISALILMPTDVVESLAIVEAANEAEIPVMVLGDLEYADSEAEVIATIGLDNVAAGAAAGEFICTAVEGQGTVLEIFSTEAVDEDAPSTLAVIAAERSQGFAEYLAESCADLTVETISIVGLSQREALTALREALENEAVTAVFAHNDTDAALATSASIRSGSSAVLVGFNATDTSLSTISTGYLSAVFAPFGTVMGRTAVETVKAHLDGEEVEASIFADVLLISPDTLSDVRNCPPNRTPCP
jgi:ribose transport system substrate-binding protein